jgi:hypothetical protein
MRSLTLLLRSVGAVLTGYVIFAVSSYAIFRIAGRAPHAPAPVWFMVLTTVLGIVFALIGGRVAALLAGRRPAAHGTAVAVLIALGAATSLFMTLGHGAVWTQVAALVCMAPAAAIGGRMRARAESDSD